jgi:cell wall assembly regulator SMI1
LPRETGAVTRISTALVSLEQHLFAFGRTRLLSLLADGIGPDQVRAMLAELDLESREDVETLYSWHDGTLRSDSATIGQITVFPGFYLLSLADGCANYRAFAPDSRWREGWLPLFADGGGDFYVINLRPPSDGVIRHFRIDAAEHPVEFESLALMIHTLAEAYETKAFFLNSDGDLDIADDAFARLAAAINPGVAWWQDQRSD